MKKGLVLTALLVLVLTLFAFPVPASANGSTYYVATNGVDPDGSSWAKAYTTIQAAVNAASSNDTIIVGSSGTGHGTGTYTENVDIGSSKTGLTIQSESGYNNTTVVASSSSDHVFDVTADNVTIDGLTIYGATDNEEAGIILSGVSGCTIENNRCGYDSDHKNYYGVYLSSSSNNTLTSNTANSNTSYGIRLFSSSNNTLTNNTANSNSYGIYLYEASANTLMNNTCNSNTNAGIHLYNSNDNTIYLNNFNNSTANVYSTGSTNTWKSPTTLCYFYSSSYKNYLGNYYSDRSGNEGAGGIGDTHYTTDGAGDNYPLWQTSDHYTVQAWWLHSDDKMYEADTSKGPGTVTIAASGSNIWIADEAAATDITFSNDTWTGQVVFSSAPGTDKIKVEIGSSTGAGNFTAGGPEDTIGDGSTAALTFTTNASSVTVPNTNYLALRISNLDTLNSYNVVTGGAWSYTSNPDTDAPDYPVPELATIILLGGGLVAIGVYSILQRRRKSLHLSLTPL